MTSILVDTCVWYTICDSKDDQRAGINVDELWAKIEPHSIVVPWPIAYETLRSKFVKKRSALELFERHLKSPKIIFFDDKPYLEKAFFDTFQSSLHRGRPLSMVDCVVRLILEDANNKINFLATFNDGDFHDVCRGKRIEMLGR